jgi:hypothetical protein
MTNTIVTPEVQRGTYERIISELAVQKTIPAEMVKAGYKIMPSVLKIGAYLAPGQSTYVFNIRKGVDSPISGESKLDQTDAFAVTGLSIRFSKVDFSAGAYSNHGNYPAFTYPDPNYFNGAGTGATPPKPEWQGLQTVVNGNMQVNVGGDIVVDGTAASLMTFNPAATYTATPLALPQIGGESLNEHGFFMLTPQYILDGGQDNSFVLTVAPGDRTLIDGNLTSAGAAATTRNILWLFVLGYKVKNHGASPTLTACRPV